MRAVIQRVKWAKVEVDGELIGKIDEGIMLLLGVAPEDTEKDLDYILNKVTGLRIFEDEEGKMNLSLMDIGGELLVISQFTLFGDVRKGRRPSFSSSAPPAMADEFYEKFIEKAKAKGIVVEHGIFGADMQVELLNNGPVTIQIDSTKLY